MAQQGFRQLKRPIKKNRGLLFFLFFVLILFPSFQYLRADDTCPGGNCNTGDESGGDQPPDVCEKLPSDDQGENQGGGGSGSTSADGSGKSGKHYMGKGCGGGKTSGANESYKSAKGSIQNSNQAMNNLLQTNPLDNIQRAQLQQKINDMGRKLQIYQTKATQNGLNQADMKMVDQEFSKAVSAADNSDQSSISFKEDNSNDSSSPDTKIENTDPNYHPVVINNYAISATPESTLQSGFFGPNNSPTQKEIRSIASRQKAQDDSPYLNNQVAPGRIGQSIPTNLVSILDRMPGKRYVLLTTKPGASAGRATVKGKKGLGLASNGSSANSRSQNKTVGNNGRKKGATLYKDKVDLFPLKQESGFCLFNPNQNELGGLNGEASAESPFGLGGFFGGLTQALTQGSVIEWKGNHYVVPLLWKWTLPLILLAFLLWWVYRSRPILRTTIGTNPASTTPNTKRNQPLSRRLVSPLKSDEVTQTGEITFTEITMTGEISLAEEVTVTNKLPIPHPNNAVHLQWDYSAAVTRKSFLPNTNYIMHDLDTKVWVLIRTNHMGVPQNPIGEVLVGTIVPGSALGTDDPEQGYKLLTNGEWTPSCEPETYVIRFYSVTLNRKSA